MMTLATPVVGCRGCLLPFLDFARSLQDQEEQGFEDARLVQKTNTLK